MTKWLLLHLPIQDMKQNRWVSFIEVLLNVGSGFLLAWLATLVVIPIVIPSVKNVDIKEGLWITITFTVISLVRSYAWRRYFNNRH